MNEAAKGAVQGVSQVTPGGLGASAASAVTGKDIKTPAQMSSNELAEATRQAGLRLEGRQKWGTPDEAKQAEDEYRRLSEAHRERVIESLDKQVAAANEKAASATDPGERDRWRSTAEMKQRSANQTRAERQAAGSGGTTAAGGTGMSHASEGNAQIQQAAEDLEVAMGAVQQAVESANSAQQNLLGAAEESQHSEADAAQGALQEFVSAAEDLQQKGGVAKQAVEEVRL